MIRGPSPWGAVASPTIAQRGITERLSQADFLKHEVVPRACTLPAAAESVAIGEVEAEQFQRRREEKYSARARFRSVSAAGRAVAVVRSRDDSEPSEMAFVGRDRWMPSKLLEGCWLTRCGARKSRSRARH
jgi:hypothetical protein